MAWGIIEDSGNVVLTRRLSDYFDGAIQISLQDRTNQERIANVLRDAIAENFVNQGETDRGPWAELAPRTVQERIRLGFPGERPILFRTGEYLQSWAEPGAEGHVETWTFPPDGTEFTIGTTDYRAEWHQGGTENMPARPINALADRTLDELLAVLTETIETRMNAA
jgi:hypothetical protein